MFHNVYSYLHEPVTFTSKVKTFYPIKIKGSRQDSLVHSFMSPGPELEVSYDLANHGN